MTFIRENLPDPVSYFENRSQRIVGKRGKHFRTTCQIHGGDGDTLSVLRDGGAFNCFSCGAKGGNLVAFEMQVNDVDFVTACKALGCWQDDGRPVTRQKPTTLSPRQALELLSHKALVVVMLAADMRRGTAPNDAAMQSLTRAAGAINSIFEEFK